jgi:hypothetical protein
MTLTNMKLYARIAVLVGLCMGIELHVARSQVSFSGLSGKVSDTSGAVVVNAKLTVKAIGTNFTRTAVTDTKGDFLILDLNAGAYDVTVEAPGFKETLIPHAFCMSGKPQPRVARELLSDRTASVKNDYGSVGLKAVGLFSEYCESWG